MTAAPPFIIYALPRSRTAWLSRFLSYGGYQCAHEQSRHLRSMDDVRSWFSQDKTGVADTAAAPWWRTVQAMRPDIRTVVVRRPVADVVDSLLALDMEGVGNFDRTRLTQTIYRLDRKLDQIERRVPGALSVRFSDLTKEATCAAVFEHCLSLPHNHAWWSALAPLNMQASMPALMRYLMAHKPQLDKLVAVAKHRTLASISSQKSTPPDGVTFQVESVDKFLADGDHLFREHSVQIGKAPDYYRRLNFPLWRALDQSGHMQIMTARSNGRMFGYLMTVIGPSMENPSVLSSQHLTFFGSSDFPGLGMKLQRASAAALAARGVGEVFMRAGVVGDGPRMGAVYRRQGAQEYGQMYKLELKAA